MVAGQGRQHTTPPSRRPSTLRAEPRAGDRYTPVHGALRGHLGRGRAPAVAGGDAAASWLPGSSGRC